MESRTCKICGETKPIVHFVAYRNGAKLGRRRICTPCHLAAERKRWRKNYGSSRRRYVHTERRQVRQDRLRDWVYQYLLAHPCVDCGETDPVVLEFDHVDPAPKAGAISVMVASVRPLEVIQSEVTKCEVRCANCHRRRTAEQQRWWITRWSER